jgi:hypothetical protein
VSVSAIVIRSIPMTRFSRRLVVFLRPPTGLPPQFGEMHRACQSAQGSKVAELIDLQWDGEPRGRSLDHAATAAVPYLRQRVRIVAHKTCWARENASELSELAD